MITTVMVPRASASGMLREGLRTSSATYTAAFQPGYVDGSCAGPVCRWEFANLPIGLHSFSVTTRVGAALADGTVLTNVADLEYTDSDRLPLLWRGWRWHRIAIDAAIEQHTVNQRRADVERFCGCRVDFWLDASGLFEWHRG